MVEPGEGTAQESDGGGLLLVRQHLDIRQARGFGSDSQQAQVQSWPADPRPAQDRSQAGVCADQEFERLDRFRLRGVEKVNRE